MVPQLLRHRGDAAAGTELPDRVGDRDLQGLRGRPLGCLNSRGEQRGAPYAMPRLRRRAASRPLSSSTMRPTTHQFTVAELFLSWLENTAGTCPTPASMIWTNGIPRTWSTTSSRCATS
jgi:hypothetical protein